MTDLSSKDLRCNVGGATGGSTGTVSVAAGSSVTFTADQAVYHQGPVSFYMTKVDDAATADGSTDWFKIKEIGPSFSGGSAKWDLECTYQLSSLWSQDSASAFERRTHVPRRMHGGSHTNPVSYSVTIPSCVAPGDYLLRIEQLGIHNPGSPPQFYISCAQIKVTGGGSKLLSPTTKIPGHVHATDPGYTANIYQPSFTSYTVPGPKVATC